MRMARANARPRHDIRALLADENIKDRFPVQMPALHQRRIDAACQQRITCFCHIIDICDFQPCEKFRLGHIGRDQIREGQERIAHGSCCVILQQSITRCGHCNRVQNNESVQLIHGFGNHVDNGFRSKHSDFHDICANV